MALTVPLTNSVKKLELGAVVAPLIVEPGRPGATEPCIPSNAFHSSKKSTRS